MLENKSNDYIKILMVEDEESDFIMTREYLADGQDFRHSLCWAENFSSGLEAMKKNEHDIFIVDYKLDHGKSGLDIVREIRLLGISTPVIFFTGIDMDQISKEECNKLNISRSLSKNDVDPTLLISIIVDTVLHYSRNKAS